MRHKFTLLSKKQIETISNQFIDELHKIPLYDTDTKKKLFAEYTKKIEMMIIGNMKTIIEKDPAYPASIPPGLINNILMSRANNFR